MERLQLPESRRLCALMGGNMIRTLARTTLTPGALQPPRAAGRARRMTTLTPGARQPPRAAGRARRMLIGATRLFGDARRQGMAPIQPIEIMSRSHSPVPPRWPLLGLFRLRRVARSAPRQRRSGPLVSHESRRNARYPRVSFILYDYILSYILYSS